MKVTFRISAENALALDQFKSATFPRALEFLNCPECFSGWDCEFQIASREMQQPFNLELDVDLDLETRPNPIFDENLAEQIRELAGQAAGFISRVPPHAPKDQIMGYLDSIEHSDWTDGLKRSGKVQFFSGGSAIGGGDIL